MNFSVLIPVYAKESPENFFQALNSIIKQTLKPSEIVIVKDGPITSELDNIIEFFVKSYRNLFKIVSLEKNMGLGIALNLGVLNCSNEIIARMDSDDIASPFRFERQISFLEENKDIDIVGSWIGEFVNNPSKIISIREVPQYHQDILKFAKFRNPMNHMTVIFRKKAVLDAGNYQHFISFEDYYLWCRMLINGAKFANIPEVLVFVRRDKNFIKRRSGLVYFKQEIEFQKKMYDIGFISIFEFVRNIILRGYIRLFPSFLLESLYKTILREDKIDIF
jgi:glycosyltransferase involved in cell wall biosynthesis